MAIKSKLDRVLVFIDSPTPSSRSTSSQPWKTQVLHHLRPAVKITRNHVTVVSSLLSRSHGPIKTRAYCFLDVIVTRLVFCYVGLVITILSPLSANPHVLVCFVICLRQDNGCNFFEWYDEGEVTGWPRRSLLEARDELRQKDREIRRLTDQVASLEGELNQRPPQDAQPKAPYLSWKHFIFRCLRPN